MAPPQQKGYECGRCGGRPIDFSDQERTMKRILFACVAVAIGAGAVPAASPSVELAIKTIEGVANDPARLRVFCELNRLLQDSGDKEDPVIQKQIEDLVARLG